MMGDVDPVSVAEANELYVISLYFIKTHSDYAWVHVLGSVLEVVIMFVTY